MYVKSATEPENEHLSIPELRIQLESLSEADILRLGAIGEKYAQRCPMDGSDLLHEAIARSLSGHRKCPRDVLLLAFLVNTMKSIAFDEKRKVGFISIQEPVDNDLVKDPLYAVPGNSQTPFEILETKNELDVLYEIFNNDANVTMLLMGLQDGYEPDEICEMEDWDRKAYNTIRKRLRRGVNNRFPKGRQT